MRKEREAEQDVAGMGNGRIGKQPADARLRERGQVAEDHGSDGENDQDQLTSGDNAAGPSWWPRAAVRVVTN